MSSVIDYVYDLEKELAEHIGFVVPNNNVMIKDNDEETNWTYMIKTIRVPTCDVADYIDKKASVDFSISHEFMHMMQEFVLQTNGKYLEFTKDEYQDALNAFFGETDIVVTDKMFANFKQFIKNSPFHDAEITKTILFDDRFYVSPRDTRNFETMPGILNHLYTLNTVELHANSFASEFVFNKYINEKQPPELMQDLKTKIDQHLKMMPDKDSARNKNDFEAQMTISTLTKKFEIKQAPLLRRFVLNAQFKQKLKLDEKLGITKYENHDFNKIHQLSKSQIEKMENIIQDINKHHKTPAQIQREQEILRDAKEIAKSFIDSLENPNKVQVIDNFEPTQDDVGLFITQKYNNITLYEMAHKIKEALTFMTKELIVDFQNKVIYNFHTTRPTEMKAFDDLIENDTLISHENEDIQIVSTNLNLAPTR